MAASFATYKFASPGGELLTTADRVTATATTDFVSGNKHLIIASASMVSTQLNEGVFAEVQIDGAQDVIGRIEIESASGTSNQYSLMTYFGVASPTVDVVINSGDIDAGADHFLRNAWIAMIDINDLVADTDYINVDGTLAPLALGVGVGNITDIGSTLTITPNEAGEQWLIYAVAAVSATATSEAIGVRLYEGATQIGASVVVKTDTGVVTNGLLNATFLHVLAAADTTPVVYKLAGWMSTAGQAEAYRLFAIRLASISDTTVSLPATRATWDFTAGGTAAEAITNLSTTLTGTADVLALAVGVNSDAVASTGDRFWFTTDSNTSKLPAGYDTGGGNMWGTLSGGDKQPMFFGYAAAAAAAATWEAWHQCEVTNDVLNPLQVVIQIQNGASFGGGGYWGGGSASPRANRRQPKRGLRQARGF